MRKFAVQEGALELVVAGNQVVKIVQGAQENIVIIHDLSENALKAIAGQRVQREVNWMQITLPETGGQIRVNRQERFTVLRSQGFTIEVPQNLSKLAIFAAGAAKITCNVPGLSISGELKDRAELAINKDADLQLKLSGAAFVLAKYTMPEDAVNDDEDDDVNLAKPMYRTLGDDVIGNKVDLQLCGAAAATLHGVFDYITATATETSKVSIQGVCQNELYLSSQGNSDVSFEGDYAEVNFHENKALLAS